MLNDFEANGYGVTALDEEHLVVLNDVLSTEKVGLFSLERKPVCIYQSKLCKGNLSVSKQFPASRYPQPLSLPSPGHLSLLS